MERDGEPSLGSHRARLPYRPLRLETERKKKTLSCLTLWRDPIKGQAPVSNCRGLWLYDGTHIWIRRAMQEELHEILFAVSFYLSSIS